jgi:hypothetical protein
MRSGARHPLAVVFCGTLLCLQSGCYGRTETYKLGGLRNTVVTVKEGRKDVEVTARFLAVDAFDTATNQKLNREKGRGFAFIGLARFMGLDKSQNVTVAGLTPTRMRTDERLVEISFRIEKEKVQRLDRPARIDGQPRQLAGQKQDGVGPTGEEHSVSTAEAIETDYRDTIYLIDTCGRCSAGYLVDASGDIYEGIASIEDETLDLLAMMRRQISNDALLIQGQRSRLLADIERAQKDLLTALRTELQVLEASTE